MSTYAALISYGPSATDTDQIVTEVMTVGDPIRGFDEFINIDNDFSPFYADLQTGEIRLSEEGIKSFVKEIWVRMYCTEDTEPPFEILMVRALDQDDWHNLGDSIGTIEVTTSACTGTGTVFSNIIGYGDGSTVVYNTPVAASRCQFYVGGVETTQYNITGTSEITFVAPQYQEIKAYWAGNPIVKVAINDFIETPGGFHRIVAIPRYDQLQLEWYPSGTLEGTHHPSKLLQHGEYEAVFPINQTLNTLQIRVIILPRDAFDASDVVKVIGFNVVYVPGAMRHLKSER
jgi:hypothetical protein